VALRSERRIGGRLLVVKGGDITYEEVDAIVNAANSGLRGGGGVDGAIHAAGGPSILEECRKLGGCPTGGAVATGAGRLAARYVFHAVGPRYAGRPKDAELLAGAYRRCMELAAERRIATIAFPSISTGIYGYPVQEAAPIAVGTVAAALGGATTVREARFILFDEGTYRAYEKALEEVGRG
jgi:O-acetyl-ADP-ribose deacetylase (regulator of RNase III)